MPQLSNYLRDAPVGIMHIGEMDHIYVYLEGQLILFSPQGQNHRFIPQEDIPRVFSSLPISEPIRIRPLAIDPRRVKLND